VEGRSFLLCISLYVSNTQESPLALLLGGQAPLRPPIAGAFLGKPKGKSMKELWLKQALEEDEETYEADFVHELFEVEEE